MTISNQNGAAPAADRIITGTGGNLTISAGGSVTLSIIQPIAVGSSKTMQ